MSDDRGDSKKVFELDIVDIAQHPTLAKGDASPQLLTLQRLDAKQSRVRGGMQGQVNDAVIAVDTEERVTFLNAAAERQYGVRAGEALGRTLAEIFTPRWPSPEAEAGMRRALSERVAWRGELLHRRRDGSDLHVESSIAILHDPDGADTGYVTSIRDITVRQQAAEAASRLAAIVESSQDAMISKNLQGTIISWNRGAEAIFGYSAEEIVGQSVLQLIPPERHHEEIEILARVARGEVVRSFETMRRRKDGTVVEVSVTVSPLKDAHGKVVGASKVARDITERRQAEATLRESEERLRRIFKQSPAGIVQTDPHGNMTLVNDRWCEMLGFSRAELLGKNVADVTDASSLEMTFENVRRLAEGGPDFQIEKNYRRKDGTILQVQSNVAGMRDAAGRYQGLLAVVLDLSERYRAEAARRASEAALADRTELLNGVLEGTSDVIFVKDLNGRVVLVNAAFAAAARSTPEQLVGKTDEDWFPPDVAAAVRQQDEAVIAGGSPVQFEDTIPVAGEARVFLTLKAPLRDGGSRVVGILGISRDITERKRIELNLTDAIAVAERANRAKSDFLSSMSHELRTPLNAILGFAQLIESGTPAPTPDQKLGLDQILKGGWYLLDLINELLDLALIESGKLSLTQEPVSLAEVMLECRAMCEPQARTRGIDMRFSSFEFADYVRADRTRVKQVVINLLSNAIKYNKAEGVVAVEWTLSPPDAIRISVRDTGEGLSPEKLAQLFQPFNRLGQEAGPQAGTGIGLVMSKRLVELMGGSIGADSVVGVGSVFWFELKRACASQSALPQTEGPVPAPSGVPLEEWQYKVAALVRSSGCASVGSGAATGVTT